MKTNDILTKVGDKDVKWLSQKEIKQLIVSHGDSLELTIVTPMGSVRKPSVSSPQLSPSSDTVRSSASSGGSSTDMKQIDSNNGTWRKKFRDLTFLRNKKTTTPKGSLRNK